MVGSAIREMAAAHTVPLVCSAFDESTIQVWDLSIQQKTGEFTAWFAFGAQNLAVHPGGKFVVTGVSKTNGRITSYEMPTGKPMWHQDGIRYPAKIRFGSSGEYLFCTLDNKRVQRISANTGQITEVLQNTVDYIEGPTGHALTIPSAASNYILRNYGEISISKLTFAVLDAVVAADHLCITESQGPVRCIDCLSGAELWRYTPPDGSHVLRLHYNCLDGFFYGVLWHYEKGDFRYLVRFDAEGQANRVRSLNSWEEVFSEAMQQLVTSSGEMIELSTGKVVGKLAFPRKEYPDQFVLA